MSKKLRCRIEKVEVKGFAFLGYEGLFWHSGKFWFNEQEVPQVFNNGSLAILLYGSSKKSIKQLRKIAQPCKIILFKEALPF